MAFQIVRQYRLPLVIWLVFVVYSYFGEYPFFMLAVFERVPKAEETGLLTRFAEVMSFNVPDARWLTARFADFISILFNYSLVRLVFGSKVSILYLWVTFLLLGISAAASPFHLVFIRVWVYDLLVVLRQPLLMMVLVPLRRIYLLVDQRPVA